jgi:hypothetical protein
MGHQHTSAPHATTSYARAIWYLIAVMAALTVASFLLTGLRVDPLSRPLLLVPFSVLGVTWWFYTAMRPDRRLQAFAESFTQILLILVLGTLLSYAAAALALPLQDANLLAIDTAFGIDRSVYIDFFARRPWLHNTITLAYFTLMPQFVFVPLVLFAAKQAQRLQQFTFAAGASLFATDIISTFTPALSAIYLDLSLPIHAELPPGIGMHIPILDQLRSGASYLIQLDAVEGLVTFPSFHTIGALLFIWALWTVSFVRWVALALNIALIAATPITGTHYFIDLGGGAVVALLAVAAARWLGRRAASAPRSAMAEAPGVPPADGLQPAE